MPRPHERLLLLCLLAALGVACKPKIGDECKISTDCSSSGDRLCDITAPAGYCTIYNCEPGSCPEDEALCVEFGAVRAAVCTEAASPSPYTRAFCMATCEEDGDCRDGYECAELSQPDNAWGAVLIDTDRGSKACLVPHEPAPERDVGSAAVCTPELPLATAGAPATETAPVSSEAGASGQGGNGG